MLRPKRQVIKITIYKEKAMKKPNIFLIMAEDICPNLGCYGDPNAKTPRLDAFAQENIKFNYCYSAAPVCSAARSSLNIGMYGSTAGVGQHRSLNTLPPHVKNIGALMQEAGYYTAIGKTDFNYPLNGGYDVLMPYGQKDTPNFAKEIMGVVTQKPQDKPLFMIQTNAITHQSQYGYTEDTEKHRTTMPRLQKEDLQDREHMVIPGYHFESKEASEIWAQYHEKMTSLDRMFGEAIDALQEAGIYEEAIVIFVGDNGHGIPSGKINLWDEGVHVPMIVHVPKEMEAQLELEEDAYGRCCNRLVSFVDFATTFLSVAEAPIPEHLEGKAFLGEQRTESPTEVFSFSERVDEVFENSRSIHERDVMYTCDFGLSPYRRLNTYQTVQSPWFVRSMIEEGYAQGISDVDRRALYRQIPRVSEQLFDLKHDCNQLNNLGEDDTNQAEVLRLREKMFACIETMRDDVLMPEPLGKEFVKATGLTTYEIIHQDTYYPLHELIELWKAGMDGEALPTEVSHPAAKMIVTKFLADRHTGREQIQSYLEDASETVCAYAAFRLGDTAKLKAICETTDNFILLLYIADLIAVWRDGRGEACYQTLITRYFVEKEFVSVDDRYQAAMLSAINMLSVRFDSPLPEGLDAKDYWPSHNYPNTYMVMNALDLEQGKVDK